VAVAHYLGKLLQDEARVMTSQGQTDKEATIP